MTTDNRDEFDLWLNGDDQETAKLPNTEVVFESEENRENFYEQKIETEKVYVEKEYVEELIKNNKPKFPVFAMFSMVLLGAVLGSFIGPFVSRNFVKDTNTNQTITITNSEQVSVENAVAQKSIPSVVGIRVEYEGSSGFFGQTVVGEGIGSGVIVSSDGYILTNSHVLIDNHREITVLFSDNSTEKAKIVWQDASLDLGIIKVNRENLPAVEFADSDKINIGDKAIAIGNPVGLNLQSTLTSGYISGLNRSIRVQNGLVMNGLIQTDASINSGNSGGALLNSKGELIGVNTAKAGNTDGIGFAIPSNIAKSIVDTVVSQGNFSSVTLGIRGIDLLNHKQYTGDNSIDINEGVLISEVVENTAADDAGLQMKDVIIGIDGSKVESMNKLKQVLLKYKAGDKVEVTVYRNGKEIKLPVTFKPNSPNV